MIHIDLSVCDNVVLLYMIARSRISNKLWGGPQGCPTTIYVPNVCTEEFMLDIVPDKLAML